MKTVEVSLIIKSNFGNKSCEKLYKDVVGNKELLKKVHYSSKYITETKQAEDTESSTFFD